MCSKTVSAFRIVFDFFIIAVMKLEAAAHCLRQQRLKSSSAQDKGHATFSVLVIVSAIFVVDNFGVLRLFAYSRADSCHPFENEHRKCGGAFLSSFDVGTRPLRRGPPPVLPRQAPSPGAGLPSRRHQRKKAWPFRVEASGKHQMPR